MNAVGRHCENATLVLDRLHVVKALGEAIDEVRKVVFLSTVKDTETAPSTL